jgi:hypothetical protein
MVVTFLISLWYITSLIPANLVTKSDEAKIQKGSGTGLQVIAAAAIGLTPIACFYSISKQSTLSGAF